MCVAWQHTEVVSPACAQITSDPTAFAVATKITQRRWLNFPVGLLRTILNIQVGDDFHLGGGEVNDKSGLLKTQYPHLGGIWSWGGKIDQAVLLLKNSSWALLSYHSLIWEIKYFSSVCSDYWQSDGARGCRQDYLAPLASISRWSVAEHLEHSGRR